MNALSDTAVYDELMDVLAASNRHDRLTEEERSELMDFDRFEHLVRLLRASRGTLGVDFGGRLSPSGFSPIRLTA